VEILRRDKHFEAGRALGNVALRKCFGAVCHVRDMEKLWWVFSDCSI
jgi:hypothetical protein